MEKLTEEEKKALRGSKFAPLPSSHAQPTQLQPPRLAHPGGPMKTNKAAALAKFLERKLQDPNTSLDPKLVQLAVNNAKQTVLRSGASTSGRIVHHVKDFGDSLSAAEEDIEDPGACRSKKHKKKKKKKKEKNQNKKLQKSENSAGDTLKRPKKKLKLLP